MYAYSQSVGWFIILCSENQAIHIDPGESTNLTDRASSRAVPTNCLRRRQ